MRRIDHFLGWTLLVAGLCLAAAAPARAQSGIRWDPRTTEMTRSQLNEIVQRLDEAAASPGYSSKVREQAQREAEFIRSRLQTGDFQIGDRVVLWVQGQPQLSDTLAVQPGRVLVLPDIGEVSLAGVLRSELQSHLEQQIARYVKDPSVRAHSLIRLAVLGQVGQQGFYTIPADAMVQDALMTAGGPAGDADLDHVEIRRGDRVVWTGDALQQAITAGRTLDQLNLQAGDRIMVPKESHGGFFSFGTLRSMLLLIPPLVYLITRL